jgi:hypothetical protein
MSFSLRTMFAVVLIAAIFTAALLYRTPILSGRRKGGKGDADCALFARAACPHWQIIRKFYIAIAEATKHSVGVSR